MDQKVDSISDGPARIAYIRPVAIADLPQELQTQAMGVKDLYAVHSENGERLALVKRQKPSVCAGKAE